jgi:hypothetical protein
VQALTVTEQIMIAAPQAHLLNHLMDPTIMDLFCDDYGVIVID